MDTKILLPLHVAHTETVSVTAASSGRDPVTPMGPAEVLGSRGACAGGLERSAPWQGKPTSLTACGLSQTNVGQFLEREADLGRGLY